MKTLLTLICFTVALSAFGQDFKIPERRTVRAVKTETNTVTRGDMRMAQVNYNEDKKACYIMMDFGKGTPSILVTVTNAAAVERVRKLLLAELKDEGEKAVAAEFVRQAKVRNALAEARARSEARRAALAAAAAAGTNAPTVQVDPAKPKRKTVKSPRAQAVTEAK